MKLLVPFSDSPFGRLGLLAFLFSLAPAVSAAQPGRAVLYAAVGAELTQYDLDRDNAALIQRGSVTLPANVQEAWLHPSHKYLYVAWSNGGGSYSSPNGVVRKGDRHGISTFRIDPASGALLLLGKPASLPSRPIFITTDIDGTHVLAASNNPSGLTVHRILPDGTIGTQVPLAAALDFGIYGHQVRADPSGQTILMVTRGNGPTATKPEDPGALKIFGYRNGVLANRLSIAPAGGFGYQVRHLDFHPSGKWVFVTLERQNQLHVYARMADGTLRTSPLFAKSTVMATTKARAGQTPSSIHIHPNGKFVYVANRATDMVDFQGKQVFAGGENSIAVFSIDQQTGEPTLIQSIDTHGFEPRTFTVDATGGFLVVANQSARAVRDRSGVSTVPASLALFRVRDDGKLEFARKYNQQTTPDRSLYWTGFVSLPTP